MPEEDDLGVDERSPLKVKKYGQQYEYKVFSKLRNALDAELACKRWRGNLASIHSPDEAKHLGRLMQGDQYWVGLNSY